MPISFLNPALLFGALAAAVPIILHLLNRRRIRDIPFSDLRFLEEVQVHRSRSLGLRRLLLLLLRVLAILLIALAVARPRLAGIAPGESGRVSLMLIVDASASMQTVGDQGARFASALTYAATAVEALPGGSEVQVLSASDDARSVFGDWTVAGGAVANVLRDLKPTDGGFDLSAALSGAARWAGEARHSPAVVVVLSDFQLATWDHSHLAEAAVALNEAGVDRVLLHRFGEEEINGGVRRIGLPLRAVQPGETFNLRAEVLVAHPAQSFWLELDGERVAEAVATAGAGSVDSLLFAVTAPAPGIHTGIVATAADRFAVDDDHPFVLGVRDSIGVLLVHGPDRGTAGGGGWRYWQNALAPAGDDQSETSVFRIETRRSDRLETGDLARADLLVFLDTGPLGRAASEALTLRLRAGAGAVFQFGDYNHAGYLSSTLLPMLGVAGEIAYRNRSESGAETARVIDRRHPVFSGLGEASLATLERSLWRRHFALADSGLAVLMTDRSGAPLLATGDLGRGRFALMPFNLLAGSTDLARNPMFLPFAQRLAAYLAGGAGTQEMNTVVGTSPRFALTGDEGLHETPNLLRRSSRANGIERLPARVSWVDGKPVVVGETARHKGFYTLVAGGDTTGVVAVAPPADEGDPRLRTPDEVLDQLVDAGLDAGLDISTVEAAGFVPALRGRELAPVLLLAAILLLLAETAISRRAG
jgi:hypothetical protein